MDRLKNKVPYIVLVVFLLAINLFVIKRYRECEKQKAEIEKRFYHTDENESKLMMAIIGSCIDEGVPVVDSVFTLDNKLIPMKDILENGAKQVFRMSELNCLSCVKKGLRCIDQIYQNSDDLIIFATYGEIKNMKIAIKELGLTHPVYFVRDNFDSALKIKELNQPYFFILDQELRFKHFFYLTEMSPDFVKAYFKNVKERFLHTH